MTQIERRQVYISSFFEKYGKIGESTRLDVLCLASVVLILYLRGYPTNIHCFGVRHIPVFSNEPSVSSLHSVRF